MEMNKELKLMFIRHYCYDCGCYLDDYKNHYTNHKIGNVYLYNINKV